MRNSILLVSAAALALAACGNQGPAGDSSGSAETADMSQVDDKTLEKQVTEALDDAPRHGLTRDLFLKGELPADKAQRRSALLQVAKDFASVLANGKVDPAKLRDVYTVPRPKADLSAPLAQALNQGKYREWVNSLAPQTPEYQALGKAFVQLVQRSPDLPDSEIGSGRTIHPGDSDPRVSAIAANLKAQGYLASDEQQAGGGKSKAAPSSPTAYDSRLVAAVKQWQADSGLKVDGIIGPSTVEALNASPRDRARTLAVAMERLRWLDRTPPDTRIDVNTAGSFLDYYRDGSHADHRKVINGQPGWETPQLGSPIFQLVANPTWTVPDSIVEEEIADKGSGWLARNNFSRKDGRWVQASGPKNSLGEVKFDMKNDQAIYLHDTPAKSLFQQNERHESHGCVRVENAIQFAHMIAQADGVDAEFSKAMATGKETFVELKTQIPVRLLYHTAWLGDDGRIHFADDAYGWDNDVATALGYPTKAPVERKKRAGDIGP